MFGLDLHDYLYMKQSSHDVKLYLIMVSNHFNSVWQVRGLFWQGIWWPLMISSGFLAQNTIGYYQHVGKGLLSGQLMAAFRRVPDIIHICFALSLVPF